MYAQHSPPDGAVICDGCWTLLAAPPAKGRKPSAKITAPKPPPTPMQPQPQSRRAAAKAPAPKPAAAKKPAAKPAKSPAPSKGAATAKAKGKAPSGLPIDLSKATPAQRRLMFQQLQLLYGEEGEEDWEEEGDSSAES